MTDGDSVTIDNLRDSANGTFVTLDDYLPLTGYEPNAMEFTNTTELNDAISSDFIDFQESLAYTVPSSDHYMDDDTLGKLLAEVHRDYADYRRPEGVSVSPSSMSVMVDQTGEPVERSDSDHFGFSVRNVKSTQNQFPVITQAERMVDRTGNLWKRWLLRSVKALVHRLGFCWMSSEKRLSQSIARKFLITNSLQLKQNKNAEFYRENYYDNNRIFVKFINKILQKWRNCKNSRILPSMSSPDRSSSRIRRSVDVLVGFYMLPVCHIKHVVVLVALHSCHHFTCCQCSHKLTFHLYLNSLQIL